MFDRTCLTYRAHNDENNRDVIHQSNAFNFVKDYDMTCGWGKATAFDMVLNTSMQKDQNTIEISQHRDIRSVTALKGISFANN